MRSAPSPIVLPRQSQIHAPSLLTPIQAYGWFIEYGGRFGTGWENRATRVTPATPAPFHAGLAAPHLGCPVLMQISPFDEMAGADPAVARAVGDSIPGSREIMEIGGGRFGLLHHPSVWFDEASAAQTEFLSRTLG